MCGKRNPRISTLIPRLPPALVFLASVISVILVLSTVTARAQTSPSVETVPSKTEEAPSIADSGKEALRLRLFGETSPKHGCLTVETGPKAGLLKVELDLDRFVLELLQGLQKRNTAALQKMFHRRLDVKPGTIEGQFNSIAKQYGDPVDWSVHQLWALNTVDGDVKAVECGPGLSVYPLYGYPLQFGLWLQAMGSNELARVYIAIVPSGGNWVIGAFHVQQWTHGGKDPSAWAEDARKDREAGIKHAAWAKYDIARKLASGGGFVELAASKQALGLRDEIMSELEWRKNIASAITAREPQYIGSMLVDDGAGIVLRFRTDKELSVSEMKRICTAVGTELASRDVAKGLLGIRCNFVLPKESVEKDGILGGMFLAFDKLRK